MSRMSLGRLARVALTSLVGIGLGAGALVAAPPAQAEWPAPTVGGQEGWAAGLERSESGAVARDPFDVYVGTRGLRRQLKANVAYDYAVIFAGFSQEVGGSEAALADLREMFAMMGKEMRGLIRVTPITDGDFTVTMGADQACLSQVTDDALIDVVRGACAGDPLSLSRRPLKDALRLVNTIGTRTLGDVWFAHLNAPSMLAAVDRRVTVVRSSVTDRNRDMLDDDGRFQLRSARTTYCLELPMAAKQKARLLKQRCAARPSRSVAWVKDAVTLSEDAREYARLIRNLSRNSRTKISRLSDRQLDSVRDTLGRGLELERSGRLRFRLTRAKSGCSVVIVFKADGIGPRSAVTSPRCDS